MKLILLFILFSFSSSFVIARPTQAVVGGIVISYDENEVILKQDGKNIRVPRNALTAYRHLTPGEYVSFQVLIPDNVKFSK